MKIAKKHETQSRILSLFYFHLFIYIYKLCMSSTKMSTYMYIKNETFISKRVIFRFLPNLRKLNKITKNVKSIHLKTN